MIPNLLLPAESSGQFLEPRQTLLQRSAVSVRRVALCSLFECRICRSAEWKANSRTHPKHQPRWVFYPNGRHAGCRRCGSIVHRVRRDQFSDSGRCYTHNARSRIGFRISRHRAGPSGTAQYMAYGHCRLRRETGQSPYRGFQSLRAQNAQFLNARPGRLLKLRVGPKAAPLIHGREVRLLVQLVAA